MKIEKYQYLLWVEELLAMGFRHPIEIQLKLIQKIKDIYHNANEFCDDTREKRYKKILTVPNVSKLMQIIFDGWKKNIATNNMADRKTELVMKANMVEKKAWEVFNTSDSKQYQLQSLRIALAAQTRQSLLIGIENNNKEVTHTHNTLVINTENFSPEERQKLIQAQQLIEEIEHKK